MLLLDCADALASQKLYLVPLSGSRKHQAILFEIEQRLRCGFHPTIMSKQHNQQGPESMGGGNSGRRTGAAPRIQSGAGMSGKKTHAGDKKSATKPQKKSA